VVQATTFTININDGPLTFYCVSHIRIFMLNKLYQRTMGIDTYTTQNQTKQDEVNQDDTSPHVAT